MFFSSCLYAPIWEVRRSFVLWRMGLDVEIVNSGSNIISVLIYSDPTHCPWMLNMVYCPVKYSEKSKFWDDLTAVTESFLGPSIVIGDFNSILDQSEKFGGKPHASTSNPKDLKLFLEKIGFIDLRAFGTPHTWSNNRQGAHHIREKLDSHHKSSLEHTLPGCLDNKSSHNCFGSFPYHS